MRIIIENCVSMNGGDAAINIATKKLLLDAFDHAEISFADSGFPAICQYYPDMKFIPLPSFVADGSPLMRLSGWLFGHRYRRHLANRSLYLRPMAMLTRYLAAFGLPMLTPAMRAIRPWLGADLIVAQGGTYLVSKYDYGPRILEFRIDGWLGLPVVAFTQSFEAFADDFRSRALAPLLRRMPLILVRHETSRAHVRALTGRDDNVEVVADAVFALWEPGPTTRAERRAAAGRAPAAPLRIAVAVRALRDFGNRDLEQGRAAYRAAIVAAVTALVRERGAEVTFVSTCQGIPEYWTDDSATAAAFAEDLEPDVRAQVTVDRGFHDPRALIAMLRGFDGTIACRLHMAILSICGGAPVLPVSYEPKFEETFADLGAEDLVVRVGEIEPEAFRARALNWSDALDAEAARLARSAPRLCASARSAGPLVRRAYETTRRRPRGPALARGCL